MHRSGIGPTGARRPELSSVRGGTGLQPFASAAPPLSQQRAMVLLGGDRGHDRFPDHHPRRVARPVRADDGIRRADHRVLRARRLPRPQHGLPMGLAVVHPRDRLPVRAERGGAAVGAARDRPAVHVRPGDGARDRAHDRLLREHEPTGGVAGGRRDGALHRRVRSRRIRDPARPLEAGPAAVLRAAWR